MNSFQKSLRLILAALLPASQMAQPSVVRSAPAAPAGAARPIPRKAAPAEPEIAVNTTVPKVEAPPATLTFAAKPTPEEIFRARLFEEPMVPVGGTPSAAESAALAAAMLGYARRSGPDDFTSLTDFLKKHPNSPWRAALLVNLGLEAYRTAHYTLCLDHWAEAWRLARDAADAPARALADRAAGELAGLFARLGRMTELGALLSAVEGRVFSGPAAEQISRARAGLWAMQNEPDVSFRCGPLALHRIQLLTDPQHARTDLVHRSKSPQTGFSLPQVAELSREMGMPYRMAFRAPSAALAVPSVIHWKVGHYAAIVRQEGGRYLIQDPTFRNDVWATAAALDAEASGYFLVPEAATLAAGWRAVETKEGSTVFGRGNVPGPDPNGGPGPQPPGPCGGGSGGMPVPSVGLLHVSLILEDTPIAYTPPVGPAMKFIVHYNQRDSAQPANFSYSNLGPKWTFDWISYLQDNPTNPSADVIYYRLGGFTRLFSGYSAATQSYATQPYDQTKLVRTSTTSYEMRWNDGSKAIFSQSDGSAGSARKIFLRQYFDPSGNGITFTYDASLRLVAIADALGQVTTLSYAQAGDPYKITRVTDPFGRFATFEYDAAGRLAKITDVLGLASQFVYEGTSDFISSLVTPYGTTAFTKGEAGTTRWLETRYPDGNRERAEFNQSTNLGIPNSEPAASVPAGMGTINQYLPYRNTYYWSPIACALAYGDYTKAKVYHWLHVTDLNSAAGALESVKEPLENRVWYDYEGQTEPYIIGRSDQPRHIGRVLDDGSTQLTSFEYNDFGKITKKTDTLGRTSTYVYDANGIDLLEARMTRNGASELLQRNTYNSRHLPLTSTDAAGQTTTFTYNSRGQPLTFTNALGQTTTYAYDAKGYCTSVDGPLPGPQDRHVFTYDAFGRLRTHTDESGYTRTFAYDAFDRLTRTTYPDGTSEANGYTWLDLTLTVDRANRATMLEFNSVRQMVKRTDPLGQVTWFDWCKCGALGSLTDSLGRTTRWQHDVQARLTAKEYADGSRVAYEYEKTTSRLQRRIDEKGQETRYAYYPDNTLGGISYPNAAVATPSVSFTYDPDYERVASMTDGTGTTVYRYYPITGRSAPGAGYLAAVDGPLSDDTITYIYDAVGRPSAVAVGGTVETTLYDEAGRTIQSTNPLGSFNYGYEGGSDRPVSLSHPNGWSVAWAYANGTSDFLLQRITSKAGAVPISEFGYSHDVAAERLATFSRQAGAQTPLVTTYSYDAEDQLTGAAVIQAGAPAGNFQYTYDAAANRLTEQTDAAARSFAYNALNELASRSGAAATPATYQWDAENRLVALDVGNTSTRFTLRRPGALRGNPAVGQRRGSLAPAAALGR